MFDFSDLSASIPPRGAERQAMEVDDANDGERLMREKEAYLASVRQRIETYEQCVDAIGVITASLEELSAKIQAMKTSTQQLNAFTSGWLTVWKRVT